MKPLLILLIVFTLSLLTTHFFQGSFNFALSGKIAMAVMLTFTAIGHFTFTKGMTMMLPDFIPNKTMIIYLTGIIETVAAVGLLVPNLCVVTAWLLIAFLIILLPANIYASVKHVDYQKGTLDGYGLTYLWFRIPLQILFIVWTYLSVIKS